jgi:hypothetical protein
MPFKHTQTSNHPGFVPFPAWIESKIAEADLNNNTAEINKINAALQAKATSVADINTIGEEGNSVLLDKEVPSVPEFNHYFDQWVAEFNVQVLVEEIA